MKSAEQSRDKELYRELRQLSCAQLWEVEVPRFERADSRQRSERVALIRAIGVVFSESGSVEQQRTARAWLLALLSDPQEKIRRYAITALPKLGAGPTEEAALLAVLQTTLVERERKFLSEALDKIGGRATLELGGQAHALPPQTEQKVKAAVARTQAPSAVRTEPSWADFSQMPVHLRGRAGLEKFVRDEVELCRRTRGKFRSASVSRGLVALTPIAPFSLDDLLALRCCGSLGFVLGHVKEGGEDADIEAWAALISAPLTQKLLKTFTAGALRYRLEFIGRGHQRGAVRQLANAVYARAPELLNDARAAPWVIEIHRTATGSTVELRPRFTPDPRFLYRRHHAEGVPAASHPPLAACLARLAGRMDDEVIWDPFCGSGLELIERALLGGVRVLYGSDHRAEAVAIAEENLAAARAEVREAKFVRCDFRDFAAREKVTPGALSLIITNPPMGRRVPIPDLRQLIEDLFASAATLLRPGGRLVFVNPLPIEPRDRSLQRQVRQVVDLGGFDCRIEMYRKVSETH